MMRSVSVVAGKPGRIRGALAAVMLIAGAAPAAAAASGDQPQTVGMYTMPVSENIPSLKDLQSGKASLAQPRKPVGGELPMETVGPAAAHLPVSDTPSAMAETRPITLSPTARPTYPEPPRSMTQAECKRGLQGGKSSI